MSLRDLWFPSKCAQISSNLFDELHGFHVHFTEQLVGFEFQKTVMDGYNNLTIEFREINYTNKSFDNLFFENKEVLSYLELFVNPK